MKTYAEVITQQAQRVYDEYMNGAILPRTDANAISFIYDVLERDVEMDIDDEYIKLVKSNGNPTSY